jgi:hypothetical protein
VTPCYVGGRGMYATGTTHRFKVAVIRHLEDTGLGFDTRYRYYRTCFPDMDADDLAEMVCDPVEFYDPEWTDYLAVRRGGRDEAEVLTEFVLLRDGAFRREARAAVMCYDEAGFGSGINSMRFIAAGKPILGFYHRQAAVQGLNLASVLQLQQEYPGVVTLVPYITLDDIRTGVTAWLRSFADTPNESK